MKYYLIDHYPNRKGQERFEISTTPPAVCNRYWIDRARGNLERSKKLLLKCWESIKPSSDDFTPQEGVRLCVVRHSSDGSVTSKQPWFQLRKEVEAIGDEFTGRSDDDGK